MRIFRPILIIIIITLVSLLYVHTEIEAIKLGYKVKSSEIKVSNLLDQNRILMYNVATLKAPIYLEKSLLAKKSDYYMPKRTIIVKEISTKPNTGAVLVKSSGAKKSIFAFFEPKKVAQAEE